MNLANKYFNWMYDKTYDPVYFRDKSYRKLFDYLNTIEFFYFIPMDGNRAYDGIQLRYRFGRECDISDAAISAQLDIGTPTVLEVMVALAIRIEESIMSNAEIGDRTPKWMYEMIRNLNLHTMSDDNPRFDAEKVYSIVNDCMDRNYSANGDNAFFFVKNPRQDMRAVDIWKQAMWYLTENYYSGL